MNERQYIRIKGCGVLFFILCILNANKPMSHIFSALNLVWCIPEMIQFIHDVRKGEWF